jgi:hypothetical protein
MALIISGFAWLSPRLYANPGNRDAAMLKRAQNEFAAERYDRAVVVYRQYLRFNRSDYDAWNQLGAAYYHTGLPKKALQILANVASRSQQKSYNYFYQGLSYESLGRMDLAMRYLTAAAAVNDSFGQLATFELAALEYNARNNQRAAYWLSQYLARAPNGTYAKLATQMQQSLRTGSFMENVDGIKKPNLESSLYKYNSWSLMDRPHFWLLQFGYYYDFGTQKQPDSNVGIKSEETSDQALMANAGIGFGPVKSGKAEGAAGYLYKQLWLTDGERINEYIQEFSDISYQPYRLDLLERRHQLFGDYRRAIGDNFFTGVYGSYEYTTSGSRLSFDSVLAEVLDVSETSLLVPFIGAQYLRNYNTIGYMYLRKELNSETPEYSNKTFDFFGEEPFVSFGLTQYVGFPKYRVDLSLELFRYGFIYNDYWLDFTRQGGIVRARAEFVNDFFVQAYVGMYSDSFIVPVLKQGTCKYIPRSASTQGASEAPQRCQRTDEGLMYQAGVYYQYSQFTRFDLSYTHVRNAVPSQEAYDRTSNRFLATATWAFPSTDRAAKYLNRYGETAFRKEID